MAKSNGTPVLVTTEHKGVFFGYLDGDPAETLTLKRCRLCVYWTADLRGFMGLATAGPNKGCRIGPQVAQTTLYKVTSVSEVTPEAAKKWEDAPWN